MKDIFKIIGIALFGLITSVIIYPALHEGGHSLNAVIVGARVVEFNLFPLPCVLCDVMEVSIPGRAFIGIGGVCVPIFISSFLNIKNFWIWYINTVIKLISALALIFSAYACVSFRYGTPIINEDATQVLEIWPDGWLALLMACLFAIGYILLNVIKQRPIRRCCEYFGV